MTNDSNHGDTGRSDNTDVAPGFWRPGFPRHESGDQVRIGMEKIIADLPEPTGMTLMMMEDSDSDLPVDVSLGEKLRGRVQEMETCGRDGMAMGVSHTTCGRPDAWLPVRVFYCHQPGCPKCWFHRVSDDLEKHRDRLAAAPRSLRHRGLDRRRARPATEPVRLIRGRPLLRGAARAGC